MCCEDMFICDMIFDNYLQGMEKKKKLLWFWMELHREKLGFLLILEIVKLWSVTSSRLSLTKVGETL